MNMVVCVRSFVVRVACVCAVRCAPAARPRQMSEIVAVFVVMLRRIPEWIALAVQNSKQREKIIEHTFGRNCLIFFWLFVDEIRTHRNKRNLSNGTTTEMGSEKCAKCPRFSCTNLIVQHTRYHLDQQSAQVLVLRGAQRGQQLLLRVLHHFLDEACKKAKQNSN